jgi:hypothetical protein
MPTIWKYIELAGARALIWKYLTNSKKMAFKAFMSPRKENLP